MFAPYEALEALGQSKLIKDQPMLKGEQPSYPIPMQPNLRLGL